MENHRFLKLGDKVKAVKTITDNGESWGAVVASVGHIGECIHAPNNYWPTVRFSSGKSTIVCDEEVERI